MKLIELEFVNNFFRSGGRRHDLSQARAEIALKLVVDQGITLAEVAGNVGVSPSAIFKLQRRNN